MTGEEISNLLEGTRSQREKLVAIQALRDPIRGLRDDVFATVVRAIKKKLNSPKLEAEVAAFVAQLSDGRVSIPAPMPVVVETPPIASPIPIEPDQLELHLEAEIAANPQSQDGYLAYGDYLAAKGDPRGEMIGICRELAKNPGDKAMKHRHAELAPLVLGKLAGLDDVLTDVDWYMGFIRGARLAYTSDRFNGDTKPDLAIADALAWLLDGAGRFLQQLTVGLVRHDDNNYGAVAAVLGRAPRQLRSLFLGDFDRDDCELNWTNLQDLSPIWPMCQALREVTLRGGSMKIGPISLPKATRFTAITGGMDNTSLGHIASAAWPELVELDLQLGKEGTEDMAPVAPLFAATHVPKLKKLGLKNTSAGDAVIAAVAESRLLKQLEELDISMSTIGVEGFAMLEQHRDRFAHLTKITLGGEDTEPREIPGLTLTWEERYGPVYE